MNVHEWYKARMVEKARSRAANKAAADKQRSKAPVGYTSPLDPVHLGRIPKSQLSDKTLRET